MYVQHLDADLPRPLRGMSCLDLLQRPEEQFKVNMWTFEATWLRGHAGTSLLERKTEAEPLSGDSQHRVLSPLPSFLLGFFFFPE